MKLSAVLHARAAEDWVAMSRRPRPSGKRVSESRRRGPASLGWTRITGSCTLACNPIPPWRQDALACRALLPHTRGRSAQPYDRYLGRKSEGAALPRLDSGRGAGTRRVAVGFGRGHLRWVGAAFDAALLAPVRALLANFDPHRTCGRTDPPGDVPSSDSTLPDRRRRHFPHRISCIRR